ncbi:hypothetical protein BN946_scf185043.g199 [Trametes cinnabarina]|uniref:Uncharacterized protein n=1 Tax=Pycnoporus cinnabarinus TaxID=5643 RepID=A0A060SPI9_PYCCI|nr:hypothetical protein BN946_scf185043.g199 [Trametes cinnabarina]
MSISVDDLVQSLKSNHIDQEAIELAALQAQLSQTLFTQPLSSPVPFNSPRAAPLNTPISCTPSSSISWEATDATWGNRGSTSNSKMRCSIDESHRESDDMDEDERMVEDLLFSPASPTGPSGSFSRAPPSAAPTTSPAPASALRQRKASLSMHMLPLEHSHHDLPSPNTSLFATTDPFYLASLQSAHPPSSSVFAQAGRPAAHSPFMKHHHMQSMYAGFGHGFQSVAPDVQSHNMFAPTAAFSA